MVKPRFLAPFAVSAALFVAGPATSSAAPDDPPPNATASQREARDTGLRYLQQTVDGLSPGTVLRTPGTLRPVLMECASEGGNEPDTVQFAAEIYVVAPVDVADPDVAATAAELWRSWGLTVSEDDPYFPYRAEDANGYRVDIEESPLRMWFFSPCFPGDPQDGIPFPDEIHQSPAA